MAPAASGRALFPLPALPLPVVYSGPSRRCQRRSLRARRTIQLVNNAVAACNLLHDSFFRRSCGPPASALVSSCVSSSNLPLSLAPSVATPNSVGGIVCTLNSHQASDVAAPNAAQRRVLQALLSSVMRLARRPSTDVCDDLWSLRQLPHDLPTSTYACNASGAPVPLVADRVALPSAVGTARLLDLLPPELAHDYSSPSRLVLPDGCPRAAASHRAFVHGSRGEYLRLLGRMHSAGMVSFIRSPRAVNSVFCVPKGDGDLRLILDARVANDVMVPPPKVELPTPDRLAALQSDRSRPLFVAGTDVDNFYYRLRLPDWLVPFFCMPPVRACELPFLRSGSDGDYQLYPALLVLPMGWSHSVFVAQQVHEHVVYSYTSLRRCDAIGTHTDTNLDRLRHSIYIDDVNWFGYSPKVLATVQEEYIRVMAAKGLPVKPSKVTRPTCDPTAVLGLSFDGRAHTLGLAADKMQLLRSRTLDVLRRHAVSGVELSQLVGSWSWCMLARRPSLAAFANVYRFIRTAGSSVLPLWQSVRVELAVVMGLAPLMWADLGADWFPHLLASDASSSGLGVVRSPLSRDDVLVLRTLPVLPPHSATVVPSQPSEALPLRAVLPAAPPRSSVPGPSACAPALSVGRARRATDLASVLPSHRSWSVVASSRWRQPEHISALEARAVSTAVRFAVSCPSSLNSRLFLLCDSLSVCGALAKGRSSAPLMLRRLRSIQALCLAAHIRVYPIWLPTELNPADGPSRA